MNAVVVALEPSDVLLVVSERQEVGRGGLDVRQRICVAAASPVPTLGIRKDQNLIFLSMTFTSLRPGARELTDI